MKSKSGQAKKNRAIAESVCGPSVHQLSEQLARQIAASEVIARPASVVKELIENSLDAGARSISVEIFDAGLALIAVTDDGCGMSREDAILSIRGHATSKIQTTYDLGAIRTLGFRGQALGAIASIANFRMQTRRSTDPEGSEIAAEAGEMGDCHFCAMPAGTRIEVRHLFFNLPGRLKFLKTAATEQAAIVDVFRPAALANHRVAFTLIVDGRKVFDLPRARTLLVRFRQIFGDRLAARMLPFDLKSAGIRARGLLTDPEEAIGSSRMIFTFINGRPIRDRILMRTIAQAYEPFIPRDRHPAAVLFVEVPHEDVEINVHPMKREVHFREVGRVFEVVYSAIREQIYKNPLPLTNGGTVSREEIAAMLKAELASERKDKKATPYRRRRPSQPKSGSNVIVFPGPKSRSIREEDAGDQDGDQ